MWSISCSADVQILEPMFLTSKLQLLWGGDGDFNRKCQEMAYGGSGFSSPLQEEVTVACDSEQKTIALKEKHSCQGEDTHRHRI